MNELSLHVDCRVGATNEQTVEYEPCIDLLIYVDHTADEGPVSIKHMSLVPIYVFPAMKLHGLIIFKTEL